MEEQTQTPADRRDWLLARLDKLVTRRETLRRRFEIFQDVLNVQGDDNAVTWLQATTLEGLKINDQIGEVVRALLEWLP